MCVCMCSVPILEPTTRNRATKPEAENKGTQTPNCPSTSSPGPNRQSETRAFLFCCCFFWPRRTKIEKGEKKFAKMRKCETAKMSGIQTLVSCQSGRVPHVQGTLVSRLLPGVILAKIRLVSKTYEAGYSRYRIF